MLSGPKSQQHMIWLINSSAEYLIRIVEWVLVSRSRTKTDSSPPPPLFPLSSHKGYTNDTFAKRGLNNVC